MTLYQLASSPWWYVISAMALTAIYFDWANQTTRRLVGAVLLVLIIGGSVVWAAEIIDPATYCEQMKADGVSWWILVFLGCW
jgi:hypothetical protein